MVGILYLVVSFYPERGVILKNPGSKVIWKRLTGALFSMGFGPTKGGLQSSQTKDSNRRNDLWIHIS